MTLATEKISDSFLENVFPHFSESQRDQVRLGAEAGLSGASVSVYARPDFDAGQMEQVRDGLVAGLDVSAYAKPEFDAFQMHQIRLGIERGLDVSAYARPDFNGEQMYEIRQGLKAGLDVSSYARPETFAHEMSQARKELLVQKKGRGVGSKKKEKPVSKFKNDEVKAILGLYFNIGENTLLVGPSGTGKTMVVRELCAETKRQLIIVTGKESMQDLDMLGAYVATEEAGKFRWVDGPLAKAFNDAASGTPTVLLIDEINRMGSKHQNIFIEAINIYDDENYVVHNPQLGVALKAPRDKIQFVATANAGQAGLNDIPLALMDRFCTVSVDYPDRQTELQILLETGLEKYIATALVNFAGHTRQMAEQMDLACGISTRSLVRVAGQFQQLVGANGKMTGKKKLEALMMLMASPVSQCAGVCSGADLDWKEKARALFQQFNMALRSSMATGPGASLPGVHERSGRTASAGIGASPASI